MLTRADPHHLPASDKPGIGEPVRRKEDRRLVTGAGCYSDDVSLPGQAYAVMVRSPHAHARIRSIDASAALATAGVVAVLTGRDVLADSIKPIPHKAWSYHPAEIPLQNRSGAPVFGARHFPLAVDKARHAGEVVAMVIGESVALARDGAEAVVVDYEPLPALTLAVTAAEPDAPRLWEESTSNVLIDAEVGDAAATEAAFARAAHVVRLDTWIPRVSGAPMEPRAAVASYDPATQRYTIHTGGGGAVRLKTDIAVSLGLAEDRVRVVVRDVGGNFGTRGAIYPEYVAVAWAARRVGRPVKWTCERQEAFVSDYQGRDLASAAELALDAEGNFLALRGSNTGNVGALTGNFSMVQKGVEINSSIYRMPAAHFRARCVVTNTTPTRPYRSSGRPEVMFVMERLIDLAARQCGFDRIALRRRNLLESAELPYTNPFGMVYDSGDYHQVMATALELSDWYGFAARRADAKARGKLRGIGVANYIDTATGVPRERAEVTVTPDGFVDVVIGTVSNGQGHETSFAQLVTEWLGVPHDRVRLITGDTDIVKFGGGSHSGRGMRLASLMIHKSAQAIIAKGKRIAAILLEVAEADLAFQDGRFLARHSNRSVDLFEIAVAARDNDALPVEFRGALSATTDETVNYAGYGYGCHVSEVEIDPDTGVLAIVRHTTVDDVGRAVNPLIIHGQTHGGIAQGVGQALIEHCFYDAANGQMLSGSFMDYAMPRADTSSPRSTPRSAKSRPRPIRSASVRLGRAVPRRRSPWWSTPSSMRSPSSASTHMEMPATPERIWRAIHGLPPRSRTDLDATESHYGGSAL